MKAVLYIVHIPGIVIGFIASTICTGIVAGWIGANDFWDGE